MLISRQGKVRQQKWFDASSEQERKRVVRDVISTVLPRSTQMCNVVDYKTLKLVYKRYAALYFVASVDVCDNELLTMEILHLYVGALDRYFGSVCELDIIFHFPRAYWMLQEILGAGELQEPVPDNILAAVGRSDREAEREPEFTPKRARVTSALKHLHKDQEY